MHRQRMTYGERIPGILMMRNEEDILEDTLGNLVLFFNPIYVLDGTVPEKNRLIAEEICSKFSEVVFYGTDRETGYPCSNARCGYRQFLLDKVRNDFGSGKWIGVLHGDEFWCESPIPLIQRAQKYRKSVINLRLVHFFLHTSDKSKWQQKKNLRVQERVRWYMWPGSPENRIFFDNGKKDYDIKQHLRTIPPSPWDFIKVYHSDSIIKQYNYRDPKQMIDRAKQRISTNWQKNHYESILEGHIFVDSLHIDGFDPCGWDNVEQKDPAKWSKPRSIDQYPLPVVSSKSQ